MKKLIITCTLLSAFCIAANAQAPNNTQIQSGTSMQPPANATTPGGASRVPFNQLTPEQKEQRQNMMAERQAKGFEQQYKLNAMQYKGVYDACLDFVKKQQSFRDNGKQPNQEENMKMVEERDAKFKQIMTEEQYKQYSSNRHMPNRPNMPAQTPAPVPAQK